VTANVAGADDAVMLDSRGFVAETNATHLFLVTGGEVMTSRVLACPEGITRATVLSLCVAHHIPHVERDLSLTEFYRADETFCTGTMGELAPVTELDGRSIGADAIGPVTRRLMKFFGELTEREGERII
jgi:branched-chain amino acid aminotransferase